MSFSENLMIFSPVKLIRNAQFLRFLWVGVINTLFGYGIFALLIYCGFHYVFASFGALCLGVVFNFITTGRIVFKNTNSRLIFRFIFIYFVTYLLNITLMKINSYFIENLYINGAIATFFWVIFSYFLNKYIVFNRINYEAN